MCNPDRIFLTLSEIKEVWMNDRIKLTILLVAVAVGIASAFNSGIVEAAPWMILDLIR